TIGKFIFGVLTIDINLGFIAITGAVVLLSGVRLINWPRFSPASKKAFYTLAIWFLFPLLLAWITSFFIPILQPKRVLYTLPALYLILSALIFEYPATAHKQLLQKISAIALPLLVLFIQCYSLISYYSKPMLQRENWRAVQQKIAQEYPRDSIVLFGFDAPFAPWIWYADSQYPTLATGNLVTPSNSAVEATIKKVSDYRYVLVFDYLLDLTDPERKIDFALQNLGFSEKEVFSFPNIGFIRVYSRKGAVLS
ncbi:hypothetical protein KA082_02200, partial [Candidatus Woesebacteria bacterium]|nr:hypothetical protein [Candidatus Woesebacteria bacterium]